MNGQTIALRIGDGITFNNAENVELNAVVVWMKEDKVVASNYNGDNLEIEYQSIVKTFREGQTVYEKDVDDGIEMFIGNG